MTLTPIKHAAHFHNGAAFKPSDWGDEGLPILRIAQLSGKPFDNYFDGNINRGYVIKDGDLLFSWSATIDAFLWNRGDAILNQHIFKVVPKDNADKTYLYYLIKAHAPRWADDDAHGSTMRHIKKESLSNKVWLPGLPIQKRIAAFLDRETARIDALIAKKARLMALLPEKEKNEISRLVMQGVNNQNSLRNTEIFWRGKTPKHWTESRLKAHFSITKRQGFNELPVLSVYREYGVIEKASRTDNINKTPEDLSKYQLVKKGDLVINKMKSWQGSLGVSPFEGITSPDYVVMSPISKHFPQYMHHLLRAVPMPTVYHLISNGIRTDQWRMEPDRFLSLPIFIPPLEEQKEIAQAIDEKLKRLRNLTEGVQNSIVRLYEYRAALITAAVTGQIDVDTYAQTGASSAKLKQIEEEMQA